MKELSDEVLVGRATESDDREAFAELLERHKGGVFALLNRILGRSDEVEDIAQNVFLAAYRGLPAFQGKARFGTWVYRIAYNQACSALRRKTSQRSRELQPAEDENGRVPEPPDRDALSQDDEMLRTQVWEAVDRLPTALRAAVELFYGQGLRYPEIAEALSLPQGTVKTHLHRARAQLRELLLGAAATAGEQING